MEKNSCEPNTIVVTSAKTEISNFKNILNTIPHQSYKEIPKTETIKPTKTKNQKNLDKRCNFESCNKGFGLMPFKCKCGLKFCVKHRHDFDHKCKYDHKAEQLNKLKKNLVAVTPDKIIKILKKKLILF